MAPQKCTERLSVDKLLVNCLSWRFPEVRQTQILPSLLNLKRHSSEKQYCFQSDTFRSFRAAHHFSRSILDFCRKRIFLAAARPMSFRRLKVRRIVSVDIVVSVEKELNSHWSSLQVAKGFFLAFITIKRSSDSVVFLGVHNDFSTRGYLFYSFTNIRYRCRAWPPIQVFHDKTKVRAGVSFDPPTSRLWAQHASSTPFCFPPYKDWFSSLCQGMF